MSDSPISIEDVFAKVQRAATTCGIDDVVFLEGDMTDDCLRTSGAVRQKQYVPDGRVKGNRHLDLGYFVTHNNQVHKDSFRYNAWAFSPERLRSFITALVKEGLQPEQYNPINSVRFYLPTKKDFEMQRECDIGKVLYN